MSRMSAPSLARRRPCSTAASASRNSPPSENESGVTFTTPMISGAGVGQPTESPLVTVVRASSITVTARSISSSLTVSGGAIRRQFAEPAL